VGNVFSFDLEIIGGSGDGEKCGADDGEYGWAADYSGSAGVVAGWVVEF
jgi:hypothetical protein